MSLSVFNMISMSTQTWTVRDRSIFVVYGSSIMVGKFRQLESKIILNQLQTMSPDLCTSCRKANVFNISLGRRRENHITSKIHTDRRNGYVYINVWQHMPVRWATFEFKIRSSHPDSKICDPVMAISHVALFTEVEHWFCHKINFWNTVPTTYRYVCLYIADLTVRQEACISISWTKYLLE